MPASDFWIRQSSLSALLLQLSVFIGALLEWLGWFLLLAWTGAGRAFTHGLYCDGIYFSMALGSFCTFVLGCTVQ
jgi:hypothetical protein